MPRIAYVNGRYLPLAEAAVGVEDRGLQFGDAVYEVCCVRNGVLFDAAAHWWRLRRGLAALFIEGVMGDAALGQVARRVLAANRLEDALLYLQVTRGEAARNHHFPAGVRPNVIMTARRFDLGGRVREQVAGVACVSLPDQRWRRCDLKTTGLLANVLAKEEARRAGAAEAVMVDGEGRVTEGGSTNVWMVRGGVLATLAQGAEILPGVMRDTLLRLARAAGLAVEERAFTLDEARGADELFLTSTSMPVVPVVRLDGAAVGGGVPGPVAARCAALMWDEVARQTGRGRPAN